MTPYLIGGHWIVLEMVLSASERVESTPGHVSHCGLLTLAFHSEPFYVTLVTDWRMGDAARDAARAKAQAIWDQFLAAWKANVAVRQAPPIPTSITPQPSSTPSPTP